MATQLGNGALAAGSYGHFDPEQREYVIREPLTPLPWINYLGSTALYSIISNTGGGYSFYRDAKLRRLTRYRYDSVPLDSVGKYLYIADGDCTWNPGFRPSQTALDHYECRHGLGYTRFCSGKNGLHADVHVFVADEDDVELQVLTLRNDTPTAKKVQIFSFVEWCQWNAEDDGANLQRNLSLAECLVDGSIICHVTGYRERRAHYAFHAVNRPVAGFDTDRCTFLGPYGDLRDPAVVRARRPGNSHVNGWWPIASLAFTLGALIAAGYALRDVAKHVFVDPQRPHASRPLRRDDSSPRVPLSSTNTGVDLVAVEVVEG